MLKLKIKFLIIQENMNENKKCKKNQEGKPGFTLTLSTDPFSFCHKGANLLTFFSNNYNNTVGFHPTSPVSLTSAEAKSGFRAAHFGSSKAKKQKMPPCNTLHWLHTSKGHGCG